MTSHERKNDSPRLTPSIPSIETGWDVTEMSEIHPAPYREGLRKLDSSSMRMQVRSPLMFRNDAIRRLFGTDRLPMEVLSKLAIMAKREGAAYLVGLEELNNGVLTDVPFQIVPVESDSMPTAEVLASANAIEVQLGNWTFQKNVGVDLRLESLGLIWPWDVPDLALFAKKISLLRELSHGRASIGVAVPMADISEEGIASFEWLADLGIDYVIVRTAAACLGLTHTALKYFSDDPIQMTRRVIEMMDRLGNESILVAVDYPWSDGYQAAQAILAGASFVGVDGYLASVISSVSKSSSLSRNLPSLEWDRIMDTFILQIRAALELTL